MAVREDVCAVMPSGKKREGQSLFSPIILRMRGLFCPLEPDDCRSPACVLPDYPTADMSTISLSMFQ